MGYTIEPGNPAHPDKPYILHDGYGPLAILTRPAESAQDLSNVVAKLNEAIEALALCQTLFGDEWRTVMAINLECENDLQP